MFTLPAGIPKRIGLLLLAAFYVAAGVNHFVKPKFYLDIMPPSLPEPLLLVQLSGVFEVLGGLGVLLVATRLWAGYGIVALLLAVMQVHINMALHPEAYAQMAPAWGIYLRLPLQLVLIAWAVWATSPD